MARYAEPMFHDPLSSVPHRIRVRVRRPLTLDVTLGEGVVTGHVAPVTSGVLTAAPDGETATLLDLQVVFPRGIGITMCTPASGLPATLRWEGGHMDGRFHVHELMVSNQRVVSGRLRVLNALGLEHFMHTVVY